MVHKSIPPLPPLVKDTTAKEGTQLDTTLGLDSLRAEEYKNGFVVVRPVRGEPGKAELVELSKLKNDAVIIRKALPAWSLQLTSDSKRRVLRLEARPPGPSEAPEVALKMFVADATQSFFALVSAVDVNS